MHIGFVILIAAEHCLVFFRVHTLIYVAGILNSCLYRILAVTYFAGVIKSCAVTLWIQQFVKFELIATSETGVGCCWQ